MAKRTRREGKEAQESFLENLIDMVERDRFTVLTAVLYLISIGIVRSLSESYAGVYPAFGIHLLTQHILLYFAVFFPGAIAISIFADIDMKKVVNVQLFGFWINMVPAFFDLLIYGRSPELGTGYEFISIDRVLTPRYWIDPVYAIEGTPIAFKTMLLLLPAMPAAYVAVKWYLRTERVAFSARILNIVSRSVATFYGVWLVLAWIGALMLFMRIEPASSEIVFLGVIRQPIYVQYYSGISPWGDSFFMANEAPFLVIQQRAMMMALDYFVFFLIFLIPAMHLWKKGSVKTAVMALNPPFLIYSALAYMLGILAAGTLYPEYIFHWPYIAFGYLVFVCVWEAVRLHAEETPVKTGKKRGRKNAADAKNEGLYSILSGKNDWQLSAVLIVMAALLAANLGPLTLVLMLALLALGYIYLKSDRGSRKRLYIASSLLPIAFINGIITPSMWFIKEWSNRATTTGELLASIKTVVYYRSIELKPEMAILFFSLLFIGMGTAIWKREWSENALAGPVGWGSGKIILSVGMLLPIITVMDSLPLLAAIPSLFLLATIVVPFMEAKREGNGVISEEHERGRRSISPTMMEKSVFTPVDIIIMLELIILALKYSGML